MPRIRELEEDFYSSEARYIAKDIADMHRIAVADLCSRHPDTQQEIVDALSWCYTYDYK